MPPLALAVGQPADGQQIGRVEQPHAVVEVEALAGVELVGDVERGRRREDGSASGNWVIGDLGRLTID